MAETGTLKVFLFGTVRVAVEDWTAELELTRAAKGILAYLILGRHRHHSRTALASLFWPDLAADRGRSALNTALWRLRRALEPGRRGHYLRTAPSGDIGFNPHSDYWLDVDAFERQVQSVIGRKPAELDEATVRALHRVLALYTGDLLEGFPDEWIGFERDRLRGLYLDGMVTLMRFHRAHGDHQEAIAAGRRIVQLEPLREAVHQELMDLYVESGQRPLAARQYETCRDVLQAELGIAPTAETRRRYERIVGAPEAGPPPAPAPSLEQALTAFYAATMDYERARTRLHEAHEKFELAKSGLTGLTGSTGLNGSTGRRPGRVADS